MAAMLAVMAVPAFAEIACTWEEDYWTGEQTFVCYDYYEEVHRRRADLAKNRATPG